MSRLRGPTMMEEATVIRRNPRAEFRSLGEGEGGVVLHLDTAAYHGLNGGGVLVWEMLDGISFGQLLDDLRALLDDAPASFEEDIGRFLTALAERDLVLLGNTQAEEG
jgi:coenzyme PQQ synthesis protein D (PqqD)